MKNYLFLSLAISFFCLTLNAERKLVWSCKVGENMQALTVSENPGTGTYQRYLIRINDSKICDALLFSCPSDIPAYFSSGKSKYGPSNAYVGETHKFGIGAIFYPENNGMKVNSLNLNSAPSMNSRNWFFGYGDCTKY